MTTRETTDGPKQAQRSRRRNRLMMWLAAAYIPEATLSHVESPRAMAQRAELMRRARQGDAEARHPEAA